MSPRLASATIIRAAGLCLGILATSAASHAGIIRSWAEPAGGAWSTDSNWSPVGVPMGTDTAEFSLPGVYSVSASGGTTAGALDLTNPDATLQIANFGSMTINGSIANDATIVVNESGGANNTVLSLTSASAMIHGSGTILLNSLAGFPGGARLRVEEGASAVHAATHRIEGSGQVLGGTLGLFNEGVIAATVLDSRIELGGLIEQSPTGIAFADGSAVILISGCTLIGGLVDSSGDGYVGAASASSTISGITNLGAMTIENFGTLSLLAGGFTNDGTMTINRTGGANSTIFQATEDATIDGTGTIVLNASEGSVSGARIRTLNDAILTHAATHRIEGTTGEIAGDMINAGTIAAIGGPGDTIRISGGITQVGAGTIVGEGGIVTLSSATILGGSLDSTGGGAVIADAGLSTLSGITNLGAAGISNFATVSLLAGGLTNHGTLTVNTDNGLNSTILQATEDATIDGAGSIFLNAGGGSNSAAVLRTLNDATITHAADHRIEGIAGTISGTMINHGLITGGAARSGAFRISAGITNTGDGAIIADGGVLTLAGATILGGTLDTTAGGEIVADFASTTLSGVTSLGDASIANFGAVTLLAGGLTNDGTLTINRTGGSNSTILQASESTTIDGAGTIVLNANGSAPGAAVLRTINDSTLTHGPDHRIDGTAGTISGTVINHGLITGGAGEPSAYRINAELTNTGGGAIIADAGFLALHIASITGGVLDAINGGTIIGTDTLNTLSGVTNLGAAAIENFGVVNILAGGLTNHGIITVNRTGGGNTTRLQGEDALIDGAGSIVLNAPDGNSNAAQFGSANAGVTATVGEDQTITGHGAIRNNVALGGTLRPGGSAGLMAINGTLGFLSGGVLAIAIADESLVPRLSAGGDIELADGTLRIEDAGFAPGAFFRATISDGPNITAQFASFESPAIAGGRVWRIVYVDSDTIDIAATCPADFTADGAVDSDDLGLLLSAFGQTGITPFSGADANGDGDVNSDDLGILLSSFGIPC